MAKSTRSQSKSKNSTAKLSESEDSICVLCLKSAVQKRPNKRLKKKIKHLYSVCCKVLKIDKGDPIHNLRKKMSFCMSCLCILKECDSLYQKLEEIQKSIQKIEIDTKSMIIKSQQFLAKSIKKDANWNYYQEFRYIAIKDFKIEVAEAQPNPVCRVSLTSSKDKETENNHNDKQEDHNTYENAIIISDDIEIKEEYHIDEQDSPNNFDSGGDWQNDMEDEEQNSAEEDSKIGKSHKNKEKDTKSGCKEDSDTENEKKSNKNDNKDDCDSESDILKSKRNDESDPEYLESNSSDSDDDYRPSATKKRKTYTKSPLKKISGKKSSTSPSKSANTSTADGESKPKRKSNNPFGRQNQLDGIEHQIDEKRWCYRSIEYFFNEEKQGYECTLCGNIKTLQKKIRSHIGTFHGVEGFGKWSYKGVKYSFDKERNRFICSVCQKDFSTRNTVGRHINFAHVVEIEDGKRLNQSGKEYKQSILKDPPIDLGSGKWKYKTAEFTKDETTGHYTCSLCSRVRKSWNSIILHIRESHNDDTSKMENRCEECGNTFGTSYRLKAHLVTHSKDKTHQCAECGEVFRHRGSLYGHVARIHEKKRPYICEYCSKTFYTRKDCNVHVRTHTKEKPFTCEFEGCGIAFALRATLKAHQNSRSHNLPPLPVENPVQSNQVV